MRAGMRHDLKAALAARDRDTAAALRSALAAIDNAEALPADQPPDGGIGDGDSTTGSPHVAKAAIGVGAADAQRRHLSEAEIHSIVEHEAREYASAAEQYTRLGRDDQAQRLRTQAAVLHRHLDRNGSAAD